MSEFDAAEAAVQAALDAGARYADARVMHRRNESMSARNGEVESLDQDASSGHRRARPGRVRLGLLRRTRPRRPRRPRRRRAGGRDRRGQRAGRPRRRRRWCPASRSPGRGPASARSTRSRSRSPTRATCSCGPPTTMREHGADLAEGQYQLWDTEKWFVSSEGHRIDQHIRESGAGIMATAIGEDETQRRSYPAARGQYGTRGWEFVEELDLEAHAARVGSESRELLTAPAVPSGETDADPRRRAARPADPRVGRPRHRARPDPRLGGGVRRHLVARPGPARLAEVRLGADEHHHRPDDPRRARAPSGTTTRAPRRPSATPCARGSGSACSPAATPPPSPGSTTAAACAPTAGRGCRWCG